MLDPHTGDVSIISRREPGRNDYFVVIPLAAPQGLSPNNEFSLVFLQMTVDKAPREIKSNSLCVLCSSFTSVCIIYFVFLCVYYLLRIPLCVLFTSYSFSAFAI